MTEELSKLLKQYPIKFGNSSHLEASRLVGQYERMAGREKKGEAVLKKMAGLYRQIEFLLKK